MTHIRLQYKPTASSRVWRDSSLTMWAAGRENMTLDAVRLAKREGWHDWRIVGYQP